MEKSVHQPKKRTKISESTSIKRCLNRFMRITLLILMGLLFQQTRAQYADTGNGSYRDNIYWFTWEDSQLDDGIHNGDSKTFTLPGGLVITATFSNANSNAVYYVPTDMFTWDWSSLHRGYDLSTSNGEALYNDETDAVDAVFTVTFSATLNGNPYYPDIIMVDAEATTERVDDDESITATTNGSNWLLLENISTDDYDVSPIDGTSQTVFFDDTERTDYDTELTDSPVLVTKDATEITISTVVPNGKEGVAFGIFWSADYGDAPDSYGTLSASGGPVHGLDYNGYFNLHLGESVDADANGFGDGDDDNLDASDDDSEGATPDDEDGVFFPAALTVTSTSYSVDLAIVNGTGTNANLVGWIDFDGDGVFQNDESTSMIISGSGSTTLTWNSIPADIIAGTTYARFRLTTDPITGANPGGFASDGEVEDYQIVIENAIADLEIDKTIDNPNPTVGSNVVFTLLVTNNGPDNATGVSVTDLLPSGYTYLSDNGGGTYQSGTGEWTIGNIASGASAALEITVTVNASGDYTNIASVTGNENDNNMDNNQDSITPVTSPVANTDNVTISQSPGIMIDVQANDVISDPGTTTSAILSNPQHGTASIINNDSIEYIPNPNFLGEDSLQYQICTPAGFCDQAWVYISVECLETSDKVTVSGYVFRDENTNQTFDEGENGESGITIRLYEDVNQNSALDIGTDTELDDMLTDANGRYEFQRNAASGSVTKKISSSNDDAKQNLSSGTVYLTYDKVYLTPAYINGLRFSDLDIPQGATITNATITFTASDYNSGNINFVFKVEDTDNSTPFTSTNYDLSNRTTLVTTVSWLNVPDWTQCQTYTTPDLSSLIQEIVNRPGWAEGNAINLLIDTYTDDNVYRKRQAKSFDHWEGSDYAPVLTVTYSGGNYDLITAIDLTTIAANDTLTTDSIHVIHFTGAGASCGNNFGVNDQGELPPVANDDDATTLQNQTVTIDVQDNDVIYNPATTTTAIVEQPDHGTATIINNDSVRYVPDPSFLGEDMFQYRICSSTGLCDEAWVTVSVECKEVSGKVVMSGFVYRDENTNQDFDAGEDGEPNIKVVLYDDVNENSTLEVGTDTELDNITTSADGSYEFQRDLTSGTIDKIINASSDDARELVSTGSVSTTLNRVVLRSAHLDGLRFNDLDIPQGASITQAYITFTAYATGSGNLDVTFEVEDTDDGTTFTTAAYSISNRPTTGTSVLWPSVPAWTVTETYTTPDLKSLVQEIVNRPGWNSGNAINFIISSTGSSRRKAKSFNNSGGVYAPVLTVVYTEDLHLLTSVDESTLAADDTLTTPNIHAASFTEAGSSCNNNFGVNDIENQPPVANPDYLTINEDQTGSINVAQNDTDPDGNLDPSSVTILVQPTSGGSAFAMSGTIYYAPPDEFSGQDTIVYQICDTESLCDSDTLFITVNEVDDQPFLMVTKSGPDSAVAGDTITYSFVVRNDNDYGDGSPIHNILLTDDVAGQPVYVSGDGNSNGILEVWETWHYSITYVVPADPDPLVNTVTATGLDVEDEPVPDATDSHSLDVIHRPVAVNDNSNLNPPGQVTLNVTSNDSDADNDLDITSVDLDPSQAGRQTTLNVSGEGTWSADDAGNVTFAPAAGLNTDPTPITYTVSDLSGLVSNEATITINYSRADLAIVKTDNRAEYIPGDNVIYTVTVTNNGPQNVTGAMVSDVAPAGTEITSWTTSTNGNAGVSHTSGTGNINEPVNIEAGAGNSVVFTITLAVPSGYSGILTNTATVSVPSGISDPDPSNNSSSDTNTQNIVADLAITKDDGSTVYTSPTDITYTIVVSNDGPSDVAGVNITDNAPAGTTITSWTAVANGSSSVANASGSGDIDETVYVAVGHDNTIAFTVIVHVPEGFVSYVENTASIGLPAGVTDPELSNNSATDTDVYYFINSDPVATDNEFNVSGSSSVHSANMITDNEGHGTDSDPDNQPLTVTEIDGVATATGTITSSFGTVTWNADGSYTFTLNVNNPVYLAMDEGETDTEAFNYRISDGYGGTAAASLIVHIIGQNDAPIANDDASSTDEDTQVTVNAANGILSNDTDVDGESLTVGSVNGQSGNVGTQVTLNSGALLTVNADGSYTYDPNGSFDGLDVGETATDTFTYTACDESECDAATVTVTINGANDAPVANDDVASTNQNTILIINPSGVLENDTDIDDETLSVGSVNGESADVNTQIILPSGALLTLNTNGSFEYDPNGKFDDLGVGETTTDSFTYTACDENECDVATVTITISGENDAPIAIDDEKNVENQGAVLLNITNNDSDVDGNLNVASVSFDPLSVISGVGTDTDNDGDIDRVNCTDGTWIVNEMGNVIYLPAIGNHNDPVPIEYTVKDALGLVSNEASVKIDYHPIASDDLSSCNVPGSSVTIDVLENDTNGDIVDPTTVQIVGTTNPGTPLFVNNEGIWIVNTANGKITFVPQQGFTGTPTEIQYTVNDDEGNVSNAATVAVNELPSAPVSGGDQTECEEDPVQTLTATSCPMTWQPRRGIATH